MSVIRYQPWGGPYSLSRELSRFFDNALAADSEVSASDWTPAVDIREEESRYVLHADLPGINPDNVNITFERGVLTLQGEREQIREEEQAGYKRVERARGNFLRRFSLPDTVDGASISAKFHQGVLEVSIPKGEAAQPRRIAIEH